MNTHFETSFLNWPTDYNKRHFGRSWWPQIAFLYLFLFRSLLRFTLTFLLFPNKVETKRKTKLRFADGDPVKVLARLSRSRQHPG